MVSYMTINGEVKIPKLDGVEIKPGVIILGEPTPVAGTTKLRALANCFGTLCVIELSVKFAVERLVEEPDSNVRLTEDNARE